MITFDNAADVLREKLANGIVNFQFKKKDGTLRNAQGTTNFEHVPAELQPSGDNARDPEKYSGIVTYFDLEKMSWRSCKVENILTIEGEEVM